MPPNWKSGILKEQREALTLGRIKLGAGAACRSFVLCLGNCAKVLGCTDAGMEH